MTAREALTFTDAMLRLRGWKKRTSTEIAAQRARADLWRHRAKVQAERAYQAECEARRLRRRCERLEDQLLLRRTT